MADIRPESVFLGGDSLPFPAYAPRATSFTIDDISNGFRALSQQLGQSFPRIFLILGNDDPREYEALFLRGAGEGLWAYVHNSKTDMPPYTVYGYTCVPPTPFQLKDWERYDVSRYVPPGGVSPEEGYRTIDADANEIRYGTIAKDLALLTAGEDLAMAICLFHSPPHETNLDRAGLDGKTIDHVPLDINVGSIAIRRFIEDRQPLLTLHGHVHESTRLTGSWRDRLGRTYMFNAAHDGPELAVIRFDLEDLNGAERLLV